jgi:hypothetical protein
MEEKLKQQEDLQPEQDTQSEEQDTGLDTQEDMQEDTQPEEQSEPQEETDTLSEEDDFDPYGDVEVAKEMEGEEGGNEDVDEKGVSWKNRAKEYERKLNKLKSEQENGQQQQAEQYKQLPVNQKKATLEAFYQDVSNPDSYNYSPKEAEWAKQQWQQLDNQEKEQIARETTLKTINHWQETQARRNTLNQLQKSHSYLFARNPKTGQTSWNKSNPVFQEMAKIYSSNPKFAQDPQGLIGALKIARDNLAPIVHQKQQAKQKQLADRVYNQRGEIARLKKRTLYEGSGKDRVKPSSSNFRNHIENYKRSGKRDDAQRAMKEFLKRSGRLDKE